MVSIIGRKFQCNFKNIIFLQSSSSLKNQLRNKANRVKTPSIPKEKEFKFRKKQIVASDTPDFWGVGLTNVPTDNVWDRRLYKIPTYTLSEALALHRMLASPEMTDNMEGLVMLVAQLDLTTRKKTKFMGIINGVVLLPHNYDNMIQGRVLAITKTDEDQKIAAEAGAIYSGGLDLIRKVERGDITADEYDYIVINPDLLLEASIIKRVLQDRFPSKKKGNLGENIKEMVTLFTHGRQFESQKVTDGVGRLLLPFGKLNMEDEALYGNLKVVVDTVNLQKPNGKLVNRIAVLCPPSKEFIVVQDSKLGAEYGQEEGEESTAEGEELASDGRSDDTAMDDDMRTQTAVTN